MASREPFDQLWDFDDPGATEAAFRGYLDEHGESLSDAERAELLSQLARTLGLQRRFDEAHKVLKEALDLAGNDLLARCRCRLEKGRAFRSAGNLTKARECFANALADARSAPVGSGERSPDFYEVDALHMLALAAPEGAAQLDWHRRAIAAAEASPNETTRYWRGSLANNLGWTLHDAGRYEEALQAFETALASRIEQGNESEVGIARWCVGRCLRSLGRLEEALALQMSLDSEGDGYVQEELAECLLALGRIEEARPCFRAAHEILSTDARLVETEPGRLARLRQLGEETAVPES
jgi:tetratricopeptide (TPR) repeat protein